MAGLLYRMGVDFGPQLLAPDQFNPKGYFEDPNLLALHERLLAELGSAWCDLQPPVLSTPESQNVLKCFHQPFLDHLKARFAFSNVFSFKDPRTVRLLPFWRQLWRDLGATPHFILIVRRPEQVVQSLLNRDLMHPVLGYLLWTEDMLACERLTREDPRMIVTYDQLLQDPGRVADRVAKEMGLCLTSGRLEELLDFIDPKLCRSSRLAAEVAEIAPPPESTRAYSVLEKMSQASAGAGLFSEMDQVLKDFRASPLRHLALATQPYLTSKLQFLEIFGLGSSGEHQPELSFSHQYDCRNPLVLEKTLVAPCDLGGLRLDPANNPGFLYRFDLQVHVRGQEVVRMQGHRMQGPVETRNLVCGPNDMLLATSRDPQILIRYPIPAGAPIDLQVEMAFQPREPNGYGHLLARCLSETPIPPARLS